MFWDLQALRVFPFFKFGVECRQHHGWGSLGARDMNILVEHMFFAEIDRRYNHSRKEHWKPYRMVFSKYNKVGIGSTL